MSETSKITANNEYYYSCSNGEDDEESSDSGADDFVIQRRMVLCSNGDKEVRTTKLGVVLVPNDSNHESNSINKQKSKENKRYMINTIKYEN